LRISQLSADLFEESGSATAGVGLFGASSGCDLVIDSTQTLFKQSHNFPQSAGTIRPFNLANAGDGGESLNSEGFII